MAAAKTVVITMNHEKDTKNTARYKAAKDGASIKYVYVDLAELEKLGSPEKIKLTVEPA